MWKIVEAIAENADTAQWEILNKTDCLREIFKVSYLFSVIIVGSSFIRFLPCVIPRS